MIVEMEKEKKMLVGLRHRKIVVELNIFLVYQRGYHVLEFCNIAPRRRRSSKLYTVSTQKKRRIQKIN
jgi:hypothetical protein